MTRSLRIRPGQFSDPGRKGVNQDFHGLLSPEEPALSSKGIAIALADGISSSGVSQEAAEASVTGFFADYYATPEPWSVKKSARRVLMATNSWLYAQTRQSQYRYDRDRGYVCTFSALVLKSRTAHLFHIGDTRIYRLRERQLEQLTTDHRLWLSREQSQLSRALGAAQQVEIDYQTLTLEPGDIFVLTTDGVHESVSHGVIADVVDRHRLNPELAAKLLVEEAFHNGSTDNLTAQVIRIEQLPERNDREHYRALTERPFPPMLEPRMAFDGFTILRELHASSRSHVYLARDDGSGSQAVIKTPSIDLRGDAEYLERLLTEEWVAGRIRNAHVLRPAFTERPRQYLYILSEYVDGPTLSQWLRDHPRPELAKVRDIILQVARGLQAFHRLEMLHQDLRPANIMLDATGTAIIIDFGAARVAGLAEQGGAGSEQAIPGTAAYTAPEYFLGEPPGPASDIFSLGVITYQMLSGELPYGVGVASARSRSAQRRLKYQSVRQKNPAVPVWVDEALRRAVHPDPARRYQELSEFTHDLSRPNPAFLKHRRPPLIERNPLRFWQGLSAILLVAVVALAVQLGLSA